MTTRVKMFGFMFLVELVSLLIVGASFRALAAGSAAWTFGLDFVLLLGGGIMFKYMVEKPEARQWPAIVGSALGGATGSVLSIVVTKRLF